MQRAPPTPRLSGGPRSSAARSCSSKQSPGKVKVSLILQNAETIRLVKEDGSAISVVSLAVGDKVLGSAMEGGRHFGMAIKETILEK